MSFGGFNKAERRGVGLLLGFSGGTGSGKTYSALSVASGIAGDKPFAVIDTESGRALHYADAFRFDHGEISAPFTPQTYTEAILAAEAARYPVVVVDNMSHVWAGVGGILEWREQILEEMVQRKQKLHEEKGWKFDEWAARESCGMSSWIDPKLAHKAMVQRLLGLRCHLILCFRAEEKVEMVKLDRDGNLSEKGKTVVRPKVTHTGLDGWVPVCEKNLPYELTASFLLHARDPGVGIPIKLQEQHRKMFPDGQPIGRKAGEAIAQWANGGAAAPAPAKLDDVLKAFKDADTVAALKATSAQAAALSAEDKPVAQHAYKARMAQLGDGGAK